MIALLATLALAAPPSWEVRVHGASDDGAHAQLDGAGLGGGVGLPVLGDRLDLELGLDLGQSTTGSFRTDALVGVRPWLTPRNEGLGALSLALGVGGGLAGGELRPRGLVGAAVELPQSERLRWRVQGHYLLDGLDPAALHLRVGLVFGPRPEPVVVEPEPEPEPTSEPAPPAESLSPPPPLPESLQEASIWSPWPECTWAPLDQAGESLADMAPDQPVTVARPGYLPVTVPASEAQAVELAPAPVQGSLIVIAQPGDTVVVSGHEVAQIEGVAVLNAPAGPVDVVVSGGGRTWEARPAIAEGYAIWLRASDHPPLEEIQAVVLFGVGSSAITPAARARLAELAEGRGDWAFRVQGSHSPEGGEDYNRDLAASRGASVLSTLAELGVPSDAIELLEPAPPAEGLDRIQQRRVVVWLEPPGGEE